MYKKVLNYFVLIAVALFVNCALTACGGDDDDDSGVSSGIVGSWRMTRDKGWEKADGKIVDEWDERPYDTIIWTFTSKGKLMMYTAGNLENGDFSYTYNGSKLTIKGYDEDGEYGQSTVNCTVNGDKMTINVSEKEKEDGITYEYYSLLEFERMEY